MQSQIPMRLPQSEFVYEALVEVGAVRSLGHGPLGERRIIDITGGQFEGERLSGKVLPGGADRQLWRSDGVRQLEALYEMQTHDGAVITVLNKVLIHAPDGAARYAFSHVQLTAPVGPYDWINQRMFVGTLDSLMPARAAVVVRGYQLV
jgi:Protein of unknown function (DUF3237)